MWRPFHCSRPPRRDSFEAEQCRYFLYLFLYLPLTPCSGSLTTLSLSRQSTRLFSHCRVLFGAELSFFFLFSLALQTLLSCLSRGRALMFPFFFFLLLVYFEFRSIFACPFKTDLSLISPLTTVVSF
ncbi:hypothetical protein BC828DRAFT_394301 [Blastocladiella britannica]|nr:hypothetical protein BC828DRAFT_394301 [Blastocladiella britannica]